MTKGANREMTMEELMLLSTNAVAANSDLPPSICTMTGAPAATPKIPEKKAASASSGSPAARNTTQPLMPRSTVAAKMATWRFCGNSFCAFIPRKVITSMLPTQ